MEMGELEAAESLFQQLVDQNCLCLEVYDYLADVKSRRGDIVAAQQLLEYASEVSPNAILRQQHLAELSEHNGDWERAEKAHRKVIRLGANSCYESPDNYFNLVRCISTQLRDSDKKDNKRIKDAEEVLDRARRRYRDDPQVRLQSDVLNASVYADAGQAEECGKRMAALAPKLNTEESPEVALELVRCYQAMGDKEQAQQMLRELAERFPDDDAIGAAIDRLSDEPLSKKGKEEAVELNRRGKELLSNQDYPQAISLFGEALRHYPNNIAVKLNLLLALIREMDRNGCNEPQLTRAEQVIHSIDTLQEDHPLHDRFHTLWEYVEQLREQLDAGEDDDE
jgi:tetratricopeptide (TPR) repeat protein